MIELSGGLLVALGLLSPVGPALVLCVMLVAVLRVRGMRGRGFFATAKGVEVPALYAAGALAVIFAGPGQYSLDHVFGLDSISPHVATWVAIAFGALGGLGNLAVGD